MANGQVFLSNPNGILFGKGAQVDVGGLVATTMNIDQADFMAGRNRFHGSTSGSVVNEGSINVAERSYVAMLAPEVRNDGVIVARLGTVALGAGQAATLDFAGNGKVNLQIDQAVLNGSVTNRQAIIAEGGQVIMSAGARSALLNTVVNNEGVVEARRVSQEGGVIRLEGGRVNQRGTLDASGATAADKGGEITLIGEHITLAAGSHTDASGPVGGGTILIGGNRAGIGPEPNAKTVSLAEDASVRADALDNGNGGQIVVWSDETTQVAGSLSARGGEQGGNGGFIETSGHSLKIADSARVSTASPQGNSGTWLLDPYDFTIASSGGDITGAALSTALSSGAVIIKTLSTSVSCDGATCGTGNVSGNGDIFVKDTVSWSANKLTLSAYRNIQIDATLNGSGTAQLALEYGQGAVASGNAANYSISTPVNLAVGNNFSTKLGSDGAVKSFFVITDLGSDVSATGEDLQGMRGNLSRNYALGGNIDASDTSSWNNGEGFAPVGPYSGIFEGLGHTISDLFISRPTTNYVGLFGNVSSSGVVRDLRMSGGSITGQRHVGGVVGGLAGMLNNVTSTVTVKGMGDTSHGNAGGLVGYNTPTGVVMNSFSSGNVSGDGSNARYI
ncbi:MAG: filamentous hemagglutinin N-terminal domain-containing protein, partial [Gammaproteobacteria bacterium]|nr:filamentous hemagglutinin N-terminal domain-containing protein [Gammaproteobacteria bacterium]